MEGSYGPSPHTLYPVSNNKRTVFIKNFIKGDHIIVGDYTYYDDPDNPEDFEKNVLYYFPFNNDKLIIGKFCIIAAKSKFIMNGANNHRLDWITTYNFSIFEDSWGKANIDLSNWPTKGDIVIGNDVWIGYDATILPGVKIGDGAVIGAKSVVTKDVAPYTIVGGNPAKVIRRRFTDEEIEILLSIRWWDWDIEKISKNISLLSSNNIEALKNSV